MHRHRPWLAGFMAAWLFTLPAHARQADEINLFAWKVTAKGSPSADFLIGTMHVPLTGEKRLPRALDPLFQTADTFLMEADISSVTAALINRYSAIAPGKQLKHEMAPSDWLRLVDRLTIRGFAEDDINALDPWYLNLIVGTGTSSAGGQVLDHELQDKARKLQLKLGYLETAEQQLTMLDNIAFQESLQQLVDFLNHPDSPNQQMKVLMSTYLEDDLKGLEAASFEPEAMRQTPDFYQKLFFDRNDAWLPQLQAVFKRDKAIVAVGIGHLIGEKGVLRMLEKGGYKVERVPF